MAEQTLDDELEGTTETEETSPRLGRRPLIIFGAAGLALLLAAAAGLYFTGIGNRLLGWKNLAGQEAPPKPAIFLDIPDLLVNLNSTGRKANFLKLTISLELEKQEDVARVQAVMPRIIDNFQVYLRELRLEDLRGSGGVYRLREELLRRVNAATAPVKVVDVLFKEMLVQ